ncbi:MAG: TIGR01212 family radical SAM protein [Tissierellia bacterium]|nr:TIGR01212 family radical SAM protein [Tissierellia bacterium]
MLKESDFYKVYSNSLKEKYGEKVYKLPISLYSDCPNRDGNKGFGGCTFCNEGGSHERLDFDMPINLQLKKNMEYIGSRYNAKKFIAYFQSFTNTYMSIEQFEKNIREAMIENIVAINISTRPDCITDKHLDVLEKYRKDYDFTIELGLQSANNETLRLINRGHTVEDFIDAAKRIKKRNFGLCVHIILNLPNDQMEDIIDAARIISKLNADEVKIHSLYILEGTKMGEDYKKGEIEICSKAEYIERVISFLVNLDPNISVQRLLARAPKAETLFCNWDCSWWKIRDEILNEMQKRGLKQGISKNI